MRKIILFAVAIMGTVALQAQNTNDQLQVVNHDGTSKSVTVTNATKITFDAQKMYVKNGTSTESFFLSKVELMKFGQTTGIGGLKSDATCKVKISATSDGFLLSNIPAGVKKVSLYGLSGSLIQEIAVSEPTKVGMGSLEKGVYVIRVGKEAFKVRH